MIFFFGEEIIRCAKRMYMKVPAVCDSENQKKKKRLEVYIYKMMKSSSKLRYIIHILTEKSLEEYSSKCQK